MPGLDGHAFLSFADGHLAHPVESLGQLAREPPGHVLYDEHPCRQVLRQLGHQGLQSSRSPRRSADDDGLLSTPRARGRALHRLRRAGLLRRGDQSRPGRSPDLGQQLLPQRVKAHRVLARRLGQEVHRPGGQGLQSGLGARRGQAGNHDHGRRRLRHDDFERLQPIEDGHFPVQRHYVRPQSAHLLHAIAAVDRHVHYLDLRVALHHSAECHSHHHRVVDDEQSDPISHGCSLSSPGGQLKLSSEPGPADSGETVNGEELSSGTNMQG